MNTPSRVWWCFSVLTVCLFGSLALAGEAAPPSDESVAAQKAEAVAAYEKFKPWYKAYIEWLAAHPDRTAKDVPRVIMDPLQKTFEIWIPADKRFVISASEQLEALADSDAKKKALADALIKWCESRREEEALLDFPFHAHWFAYMQGRTCAAIGDAPGARKVWSEIVEDDSLNDETRKQLLPIRKWIIRDLVALEMKAKHYEKVVEILDAMLESKEYSDLLREDLGKHLLITYAQALSLQAEPDYEKAIHTLQKAIDAEPQQAERTQWSARFAAAVAETAARAQTASAALRLTAPEWHSAAFGDFVQGENERAIGNYRRAIAQSRHAKTPLPVRMAVEPRCWMEMGYCYLRLKQYFEAVIAFQALRENYSAAARERWVDPLLKAAPRKDLLTKALQEPLKNLEPLLERSSLSLKFAFAENRRIHPNAAIQGMPPLEIDPGKENSLSGDLRFDAAFAELALALAMTKESRTQTNAAMRSESASQAAAKFISAAEKFSKIDSASKAYEAALYQAGSALSQAQSLWAAGKIAAKSAAERDEASRKLATQALEAFQKYEALTAGKIAATDDVARRQQREGPLLLSRAALFAALADWEKSATAADAYLLWEQRASQTQSFADAALLHKFRALIELAASKPSPQCDPFLADAESALIQRQKLKPDDAETFAFMLHALARRYTIAAAQAERLAQNPDAVRAYHLKLADLQQGFIAAQSAPTLADFSSLIYQLEKSGDKRRTTDAAKRMLESLDPNGLGVRIPDSPEPWQELLQKMTRVIKYADLAKWDRCKADHKTLIDYLYDTTSAAALPENDARRPDFDRFNLNLEKALTQLETIKKNFADCQTLDPRQGENGNALLAIVEDEIDFRRKITAARELLVSRALDVAAEFSAKNKPAEARAYRELANTHLKIILTAEDTPQRRLQAIELDMADGKFDDARQQLTDLLPVVPENSVLAFDIQKKLSEVHAALGKWSDAADFPQFLILTIGDDAPRVKDRWPDIRDFLQRCYDHGVKKR